MLERFAAIDALLFLFRALPDDAGETLERNQRFAGVGPFLQLLNPDMIERLPAGATFEQGAGDVDHVWRADSLVKQRRTASGAEASRRFRRLVFKSRDLRLSPGDTKKLAPASDISGVGRAVRLSGCA